MTELLRRKVGIIACSGEEIAEGTVTRLAALRVLGAQQVSLQENVLHLSTQLGDVMLPLIGAGALSLPGIFLILQHALTRRRWDVLAGILWLGGYLLMYAWRLPVTYQHGRYVIPAMPVYFIWSLAGLAPARRSNARIRA